MCRCAGVPARMTAVGAGSAGVPARTTDEARDPGVQLFCAPAPPSLSRVPSRRRDPVNRRCIARNGAVARFMALLFRREKKRKKEKKYPPLSANSPNITGFGVLTTFAVCAMMSKKRGQFGTKVRVCLHADYEIIQRQQTARISQDLWY